MHMEYTSVALPKTFSKRFWKIAHFWGYRTFAELVVGATRDKLRELELVIENMEVEKSD